MSVYPDELNSILFEEIAHSRGKVSLEELWRISGQHMNIDDEKMKRFVYSSLMDNKNVILMDSNLRVIDKLSYDDIVNLPDSSSLKIGITEDNLWRMLTGYTKKESTIGNLAFDLLLEIASAKEKGVNTMQLARNTGQDPRSVTGRIKKLGNLVVGNQVIYKGHVVRLMKLLRYSSSENSDADEKYINIRDYLPKLVDIVKNSKNGVRQITDLRRQLKFDQDKRLAKAFLAAISWLDENGYLKKVLVVAPNNPAVEIRCVKYLRDYLPENKEKVSLDLENDSQEEQIEDDSRVNDAEIVGDYFDSIGSASSSQGQALMVQDYIKPSKYDIQMNRFYPIQNQVYDLVEQSGTTGLSSMKLIDTLCGPDYKRNFNKSSEYYLEKVGKQGIKPDSMGIVRVYDFEGKKKFHRLFTQNHFQGMMDLNGHESITEFSNLSVNTKTLNDLNKIYFTPLNNTLRFFTENGIDRFFWHGELNIPLDSSSSTRGRKRKDCNGQVQVPDEPKTQLDIKRRKTSSTGPSSVLSNPGENDFQDNNMIKKKVVDIDGFTGGSLRSLQRQRAILEVLKLKGGVIYWREQFFDDVRNYMQSTTMLDKKTARGDIEHLVERHKLVTMKSPLNGRTLISLPGTPNNVVTEYVKREKDLKKTSFKDIVRNTDIYFFDQTQKDKFHRGVKSVERIRKYQQNSSERNRRKKGISDKSKCDSKLSLTDVNPEAKARKSNGVTARFEKGENFNVSTKNGLKVLIMAVVISKSITHDIAWNKISSLFPKNSLEKLKKQWTTRRIKMGDLGWKAYVSKWKRVLVHAIKNEIVSLDEAEDLQLSKLIRVWLNYETKKYHTTIELYQDIHENRNRLTLLRASKDRKPLFDSLLSSMIQRELYHLKTSYTYSNKTENREQQKDSKIESIQSMIKSVLIEKHELQKNGFELFQNFDLEELDIAIMKLVKSKYLLFRGSRLEATNKISELLENRGYYRLFERYSAYKRTLKEFLEARTGVLIYDEVKDSSAPILIDLLRRGVLVPNFVPITHYIRPLSYTSRKFDIKSLTPPIILTQGNNFSLRSSNEREPIPLGPPFSRLWIDGEGQVREHIWKALTVMVVNSMLFLPGIDIEGLTTITECIISYSEMSEVCEWLTQKKMAEKTAYGGYILTPNWYCALD